MLPSTRSRRHANDESRRATAQYDNRKQSSVRHWTTIRRRRKRWFTTGVNDVTDRIDERF